MTREIKICTMKTMYTEKEKYTINMNRARGARRRECLNSFVS